VIASLSFVLSQLNLIKLKLEYLKLAKKLGVKKNKFFYITLFGVQLKFALVYGCKYFNERRGMYLVS